MRFALSDQLIKRLPTTWEDTGDDVNKGLAKSDLQQLWLALIAVTDHEPVLVSCREQLEQRTADQFVEVSDNALREQLVVLAWLQDLCEESPYSLYLHAFVAEVYHGLGYPDLAAASMYKSLLLQDATMDDSDEYHDRAMATLKDTDARWSAMGMQQNSSSAPQQTRSRICAFLSQCLLLCGCLRSAHFYCLQAMEGSKHDEQLDQLLKTIQDAATEHYSTSGESAQGYSPTTWPDSGMVRRERYPWNTYEPDRLHDLEILNEMMQEVAPKLEVQAAYLPALTGANVATDIMESIQLGVFAREDLQPGEVVLKEVSLLTANNKVQDALCDACSVELPELGQGDVTACEDCQVVFCSQSCHDLAQESYHPAVCDREVEAIAKNVPLSEASDSLYSLLLLRAMAMSETQDCHPLDLKEVKYIWGDFIDVDYTKTTADGEQRSDDTFAHKSHTLPFSFKYNITLPLHMLEKMDIDVFEARYDTWVLNTLYAKFRGTASARLSGLGGRAIRGPEVCAVHPMWCLANHSCDPNVAWNWGGEIEFRVRQQRAQWQDQDEGKSKSIHNKAGVRKGDEILNHYCDIDLPVKQRREWARGALGGDCMCERCIWEQAAT